LKEILKSFLKIKNRWKLSEKRTNPKNFEIFKIFEKSKNAGNCPKSAQNQKVLKNSTSKIFSKISKILGFVRFQTFSSVF
jgi:hypothetical protein